MISRILLPLDGSDIAEKALPYGEELASKLGSELILYHVHSREHQQQKNMYQVYLDSMAQRVRSHSGQGKIKVSTKIEAGEAPENICNLVGKSDIDLIVMTAVSGSGVKVGKLIGSVTDHVCRSVPIPVMLIRPDSRKQPGKTELLFNKILVPLDGSDLSKMALPIAEELAISLKLQTTLFEMAAMVRLYDDGSGATDYGILAQFNKLEKDRVTEELNQLQTDLKEKGLDVTSTVISGFDAAYEIMEICKKKDIGLVVMSTHGRTGLSRWVLGNVAEKILRHGETNLLLVHAAA
jgi:nucleotide-binding universal stress UspA family protein